MNLHGTLTTDQKKKIQEKIKKIESQAHTKIAIQILPHHQGNLFDKAVELFSKHRLHHPEIKTGILILISLKARQFQLLGDKHIHEKIGEKGWNDLAKTLSESFKEGNFYEGLEQLLDDLEIDLSTHFAR